MEIRKARPDPRIRFARVSICEVQRAQGERGSRGAAGERVARAVGSAGALERPGGGKATVHGRERAAAAVLQAGQGEALGGRAGPGSLLTVEGYVLQPHGSGISTMLYMVVIARCS